MADLIKEILFVGMLTMIIGLIISYITMYIGSPIQTKQFDHWGSVAFSFVVTGMLIHIICEYTGINKYYCVHGVACRTK